VISSEVQRTLVKSPPELWTELSDPESLARHLGELGEITITRTEPENLVEWEAEGTTGTVEISPSGWGTRVTLTVVRELPEELGEPAQADETGETDEATPATAWTDEPSAEAVAGTAAEPATEEPAAEAVADETAAADETPAEVIAGTAAETPAEAAVVDPVETREPDRETPELARERRPAPATEAARRAAGWPSTGGGPAIESDLRAAEAVDGPPAEPHGLEAWVAQSIEADPPQGDAGQDAEPEPEPEPETRRRGFFARLFSRRRRDSRQEAAGEPHALEALVQPDDPEDEMAFAAEELDEPVSLGEDEPTESDTDGEQASELVDDETDAGALHLEAALQTLGEPDAEALDERREPASEVEEPAVRPDAAEAPEEPMAAPSAPEAGASRAGAPAPAPEPTPAPAEPVAAGTPAGTSSTPQDLSDELRAAEEEVEAVLTAVLDRLGSAHHRPFSRP